MLIGGILNALYNENRIDPVILAQIGQYAENEYFGKPCGLMDQISCAVGGIVHIDFMNKQKPKVTKINFDFNEGIKLFLEKENYFLPQYNFCK